MNQQSQLNLQQHSQLERGGKKRGWATFAEYEPPRSSNRYFINDCFTWFQVRSSRSMVAFSIVNWRYLLDHASCSETCTTTYNLLVKHPITRLASSLTSQPTTWRSGQCWHFYPYYLLYPRWKGQLKSLDYGRQLLMNFIKYSVCDLKRHKWFIDSNSFTGTSWSGY